MRLQAMKTPIIHLLAVGPSTEGKISEKTHIPKEECAQLLQKYGRNLDGKWQLADRTYKDLDLWNFGYTSQDDRQAAIDNAVKAFDRMRLGKEEKIWQMLLPVEERNKGKVLSRLHLGGAVVGRGLTPNDLASSPLSHADGADETKATGTKATPLVGSSGTPKTGSTKVNAVTKRLLSKNGPKARANEEAKERTRKEKDAAASDRESKAASKKVVAKKAATGPKIKSADVVHSSDEEGEDDAAVNAAGGAPKKAAKLAAPPKQKSRINSSSDSEAKKPAKTNAPTRGVAKAIAKRQAAEIAKASSSPAVNASRPAKGDKVKADAKAKNLSTPSSSQSKTQLSPTKTDSRPTVPSPLGAARPRVASDVSNSNAIGVQQKAKHGAETPQNYGMRPRHDTVVSNSSHSSDYATKKRSPLSEVREAAADKACNSVVNGNNKSETTSSGTAAAVSTPGDSDNKLKRKANDLGANMQQQDHARSVKHRKTDSSVSQQTADNSSVALTSPSDHTSTGSEDGAPHILRLSYEGAVNQAEKFVKQFYPAYTKLYDEQAAKEARGEVVSKEERGKLWTMHRRLEDMKREILLASAAQQQQMDR